MNRISDLFSCVFPFLAVTAFLQYLLQLAIGSIAKCHHRPGEGQGTGKANRIPRAMAGSGLAAIIAVFLLAMPLKGIPTVGWVVGLNANFSIPLTVLVFSQILHRATGLQLLDRQAVRALWVFGLMTGLTLYPASLGFGPRFSGSGVFDPYALGYGSIGLSLPLLALTLELLRRQNRLGAVLTAAMIAYDLQLLESPNLWDYLIDPVLAVLSLTAVAREALSRRRSRAAGAIHGN